MNFTTSDKKQSQITNNKERRATLSNLRLGYNACPNPLLNSKQITFKEIGIYMYIVYLTNSHTEKSNTYYGRCCKVSLTDICKEQNINHRTLVKSLRKLEKYNLIVIDDGVKPWIICTTSILDWAI